jgi:hypothetical protein
MLGEGEAEDSDEGAEAEEPDVEAGNGDEPEDGGDSEVLAFGVHDRELWGAGVGAGKGWIGDGGRVSLESVSLPAGSMDFGG